MRANSDRAAAKDSSSTKNKADSGALCSNCAVSAPDFRFLRGFLQIPKKALAKCEKLCYTE